MKPSRPLITLLFSSGLALAAIPALAQSSSGTGSPGPSDGASSSNPSAQSASSPSTPAAPAASQASPSSNPKTGASSNSSPATTHRAGPSTSNQPNEMVPKDRTSEVNAGAPSTDAAANSAAPATSNPSAGNQTAPAGLAGQFNGLDRDGDGRISADEFLKYSNISGNPVAKGTTAPAAAETYSPSSNPSAQSSPSTAGTSRPAAQSATAPSDSNASPANSKLFQQLDKNHDGYLSRDELAASGQNK